jgi:hypothetical protein
MHPVKRVHFLSKRRYSHGSDGPINSASFCKQLKSLSSSRANPPITPKGDVQNYELGAKFGYLFEDRSTTAHHAGNLVGMQHLDQGLQGGVYRPPGKWSGEPVSRCTKN